MLPPSHSEDPRESWGSMKELEMNYFWRTVFIVYGVKTQPTQLKLKLHLDSRLMVLIHFIWAEP